jgi:hypothetical protein
MTPEQKAEALKAVQQCQRTQAQRDAAASVFKLLHLIDAGAPDMIKTHYLVYVLVPRLTRLWGVENLATCLNAALARGLGVMAGVCQICLKAKPEYMSEERLCVTCRDEVKKMESAMDVFMDQTDAVMKMLNGGE